MSELAMMKPKPKHPFSEHRFSSLIKDIRDTCTLCGAKKMIGVVNEAEKLEFEIHQHEKICVRKDCDNGHAVSKTLASGIQTP